MGLKTWKKAPSGKILKRDIATSKNYLEEGELSELNQVVNMYLDHAELQARRQVVLTMADWASRLDAFLQFNGYDVLTDAGNVSATVADSLATAEYEKFRVLQDRSYESDFDLEVKKLVAGTKTPKKPLPKKRGSKKKAGTKKKRSTNGRDG